MKKGFIRSDKKLKSENLTHKHEGVLKLINIAKGHLNGVEKMILEDKYCIDISKQILAVISLLKKINTEILKKHLETCVKESRDSEDFDVKINELKEVVEYLTKIKEQ